MKTGRLSAIAAMTLMIVAAFTLSAKDANAALTAKANHDHITMDFFYNGSEVSVRGVSDPDVDLVVKITSPDGHQELKKQGKVGGFLWMNVGSLEFEDTPNLYFLQSTRRPEDILSADEMDRYVIGFPALSRHVRMSPVADDGDKEKWFGEFVNFKESSKTYFKTEGGFRLDAPKDGSRSYYMKFAWPYQAPPGNYLVTVYAVKDHKVVEQATSKVLVEQVGVVKALSGMAKNNGALYGIISIASALGAGFGVGLIFGKGGGAH